jgi:uncharacterized protein Usg
MSYDEDFALRMQGYSLVTVNVLYYMPDHRSLVNEFIWQCMDIKPRYPRIEQFLDHWRREINAIIKEVMISDSPVVDASRFTRVDALFRLH